MQHFLVMTERKVKSEESIEEEEKKISRSNVPWEEGGRKFFI